MKTKSLALQIGFKIFMGTRTNVRETNVRVDKRQSDKRQRRQTSE